MYIYLHGNGTDGRQQTGWFCSFSNANFGFMANRSFVLLPQFLFSLLLFFFFLLLCGSFFPFFPTTELLHHQRLKDKFNRLHAANDCDFDFDQLWCFSSPHHRTFSSLFALASDRGSFQLVLYFFSLATLRKVAKFPPPKVTNLTLGTTNGYLRTRCNRTEYSPTARQRHTTLKIGHQRAMIDSRALCGRNS